MANSNDPRMKALEAQREEAERRTAEQLARQDASQPTPTQAENDMAKMGMSVDEKEDHGGEPEGEAVARVFDPGFRATAADYATRDMGAGRGGRGAKRGTAKRAGGRAKGAAKRVGRPKGSGRKAAATPAPIPSSDE
jgi:hypothetical protein